MGTLSPYAWASPPMAFSAPGPPWVMTTPNVFPVVQPAEAVGRHQRPAFLAEHQGADALLGHGLDQVVGGEAADPLDAFCLEDAGRWPEVCSCGLLTPFGDCSGLRSRRPESSPRRVMAPLGRPRRPLVRPALAAPAAAGHCRKGPRRWRASSSIRGWTARRPNTAPARQSASRVRGKARRQRSCSRVGTIGARAAARLATR